MKRERSYAHNHLNAMRRKKKENTDAHGSPYENVLLTSAAFSLPLNG